MDNDNNDTRAPRSPRQRLTSSIEFIGDFDILEAQGVDISETGVCFEVPEPLRVLMRFEGDDGPQARPAQLVWLQRLEDGGCRLGLEFLPGDAE